MELELGTSWRVIVDFADGAEIPVVDLAQEIRRAGMVPGRIRRR